jgi:hypothetical protein
MLAIRTIVAMLVIGTPAAVAAQGGEFDPPPPVPETAPTPDGVGGAQAAPERLPTVVQPAPVTQASAEAPTTVTATATASTSGTSRPPEEPPPVDVTEESTGSLLHGFRLGYAYMFQPPSFEGEGDLERYGLESPHNFLIGYEMFYRVIGHSWLNVLLVGNVIVAGLDQSKFLPSVNLLLGFEFDESFQVGLGMNLAPDDQKPTHMIVAAGWTPRVGNFYVPLHAFFVPDVDGFHRIGATVGVTL